MTLLMLCGVMFFRCLGFIGLCQGMLLLCYLEGEIGLANMAQRCGPWCWLARKEQNRLSFEEMESSLDQLKTLFGRLVLDLGFYTLFFYFNHKP